MARLEPGAEFYSVLAGFWPRIYRLLAVQLWAGNCAFLNLRGSICNHGGFGKLVRMMKRMKEPRAELCNWCLPLLTLAPPCKNSPGLEPSRYPAGELSAASFYYRLFSVAKMTFNSVWSFLSSIPFLVPTSFFPSSFLVYHYLNLFSLEIVEDSWWMWCKSFKSHGPDVWISMAVSGEHVCWLSRCYHGREYFHFRSISKKLCKKGLFWRKIIIGKDSNFSGRKQCLKVEHHLKVRPRTKEILNKILITKSHIATNLSLSLS